MLYVDARMSMTAPGGGSRCLAPAHSLAVAVSSVGLLAQWASQVLRLGMSERRACKAAIGCACDVRATTRQCSLVRRS